MVLLLGGLSRRVVCEVRSTVRSVVLFVQIRVCLCGCGESEQKERKETIKKGRIRVCGRGNKP